MGARGKSADGPGGAAGERQLELVRHLANWIAVREYLRAHPEVAALPVRRPVFVVGLPRTRTTLLHALLAGVPGHRAARMWELIAPVPRPESRLAANPVAVLDEILRELGTSLPPHARQQAIIRAGRPARRAHRYSLERYGLTARDVSEAFGSSHAEDATGSIGGVE